MKKITKKSTVVKPKVIETPKATAIDKLTISFPSVDMNKVVEKINELIDKANDSI